MAIKSSDQISLVDLTDGYSVILTNDSYTFAGSVSAANNGSTTTQVIALCGSEAVSATVTQANIVISSMSGEAFASGAVTVSVNNGNGSLTQPIITIQVANTATEGGTVDIPVSITGTDIVIHKLFTFAIAFKGNAGSNGSSAQWYSGTGITGTSTTATIYSGSGVSSAKVGDMYINTDTQNIYRCTTAGNASAAKWVYVSCIKGAVGATGSNGSSSRWHTGTGITGTNTTAQIFSNSGVSSAVVGDMYLNTSTYNTYRCTVAGAASAAKWAYVNNIKGAVGATGATGAAGADAITMTITSSAGTIFKNTSVVTILTAHVYKAGVELNASQISALGTIKWYKDGSSTALSTTGATLSISSGDVLNKATYVAQLEA